MILHIIINDIICQLFVFRIAFPSLFPVFLRELLETPSIKVQAEPQFKRMRQEMTEQSGSSKTIQTNPETAGNDSK